MALPTCIAELPKQGNDVFIRVRVIYKSNLITCKTGSKQLRLHFMDSSDTICAIAYNKEAIKFFEIFQVNKVYELYNFYTVKVFNKSFTNLPNNYEIKLMEGTKAVLYEDKGGNLPAIDYNFVPIAEIHQLEESKIVDCIAMCRKVDFIQTGTTSFNRDYQKRNIQLVDTSGPSIELTLWNDDACKIDECAPFVIAVRRAIIKIYKHKKSLAMTTGSSIEINPNLPETDILKKCLDFEWRDSLFCRNNFPPVGSFKTKGVIHCINCSNLYYEACQRCSKKVSKGADGLYSCRKCKINSSGFKYKLRLNMFIGEPFTTLEVTCFNEFIENFIGQSAEKVVEALIQDPTNAEEIFKAIFYKTFIFNIAVENQTYEGELQSKSVVMSATPINYKEYNKYLINNLKKFIPIAETETIPMEE